MALVGEIVTYFKSTLVGIITALLAVIIVVLVMLRVWMSDGAGGIFISFSTSQLLIAALVGFAAGFWFSRRRSRVRQA